MINLWIYYAIGYIIAIIVQEWANKKRGEPFDDPEFLYSDKKIVVIALIWIFGGFAISIFVPVSSGVQFYVGLILAILGESIGILALYSFANNKGLTTSRIHKYSRNPIYLGWDIFMGGLAIMGFSLTLPGILFLLFFFITIPYLHWTILLEERFLSKKYGESYAEYMKKTPRYFGFKK